VTDPPPAAPPDLAPPGLGLRCTACATPVERDAATCPSCGLRHPTRVLARGGLWIVAAGLCVIWALTFVIVAGTR
jgi:hypothetical protein